MNPLATILAIAVAAKLAGYHGATPIGEFSQGLTQRQLRALRAFYSHRLGRFTAPSTTAFVKVLTALDPDALDRAAQHASHAEPVAIDGKHIHGAARHNPGAKHLLVAAAEHRSGLVLGQEAVEHKSNEIPTVRTLVTGLNLQGRVVTLDAMHTQDETAQCLVDQCAAHYVTTAVKDNRPEVLRDLAGLDWERPEMRANEHRSSDKGHGRLENRVHYVRDVSYDEDRCRVRTGHLPRNLACLNNLAISIVRIQGRFEFIPQAHRYYARRPQDAVQQLLEPPKR